MDNQPAAMPRLRIIVTASEAVPWSKTGGLADVSTALAKSLSAAGHDVTVIVPYHRGTPFAINNIDLVHDSGVEITVPVGDKDVTGRVCWADMPSSQVRLLLVDQPDYFDRDSLYQDKQVDYQDNLERFVFFSRAVMEVARKLVLRPDIIHVNDWQTALIPALLDVERRGTPGFESTKCVLTIHNLAFQGWFPASGTGAHSSQLGLFQLAADGMPRTVESVEDRCRFCRPTNDSEPDLRDRNPDA